MRKHLFAGIVLACLTMTATAKKVVSPNGRLSAETKGQTLIIKHKGRQALQLDDMLFANPSAKRVFSYVRKVKDDYRMLTGKRLHCFNEANEYTVPMQQGVRMRLRLYNDGITFRYEFTGEQARKQWTEQTIFRIPEGTRRWMQQWTEAYEGFFPLETTYQIAPVPSFSGVSKSADGWNNRWGFPALLEPEDGLFVLLSEANIERGQSASCLYNDKERFSVVQAELQEGKDISDHTPWRIAIIGNLADVVESTLVTDVSEPCQLEDTNWIQPGVVSWVYWAYNHGSNDLNIIKQYVDMAVRLHLPYVLIDAEWDEMKDGKSIEDAVAYAKQQGIKPMIWYNSSVGWVNGAPGPKYRLNKAEDREREFAWCERLGVAGVKIDFFSGDNQMNMEYCLDLLECAARHHLLVNFHGATIPRGWQRTWPNLMSTEGVYGAEWYNNVPTFTDKAASHNATLPFTRNVIGPMDYTPCAFSDSQHPHITSHAHELALTVLFESGLQHLADRPESFYAQPKEVQDFLSTLPNVWDETRLLSGYPGESIVMARRSGQNWYVAGINGTNEQKVLNVYPALLGRNANGICTLFADDPTAPVTQGKDSSRWSISQPSQLPTTISCQPRGGFVWSFIHQ